MKILVLHASPRKDGQTEQVLKAFLGDQDTNCQHVFLYDERIEYCKGCLYCGKKGICFIDDDMQKLYTLFETVDVVVLASPMYFNSVSSAAKVMIDRTQQYWSRKFSLGHDKTIEKEKQGIFICTAGAQHDAVEFSSAKRVVEIFFKAINAAYEEDVLVDDLDRKPLSSREDELASIKALGTRFFSQFS